MELHAIVHNEFRNCYADSAKLRALLMPSFQIFFWTGQYWTRALINHD